MQSVHHQVFTVLERLYSYCSDDFVTTEAYVE